MFRIQAASSKFLYFLILRQRSAKITSSLFYFNFICPSKALRAISFSILQFIFYFSFCSWLVVSFLSWLFILFVLFPLCGFVMFFPMYLCFFFLIVWFPILFCLVNSPSFLLYLSTISVNYDIFRIPSRYFVHYVNQRLIKRNFVILKLLTNIVSH